MKRPFAICLGGFLVAAAFFVLAGIFVVRYMDDAHHDYYVDLCDDTTDDPTAAAALRLTGEEPSRGLQQKAVVRSDEVEPERERQAKAVAKMEKEQREQFFLMLQQQMMAEQQANFNNLMMQMMNMPLPTLNPTPSPSVVPARNNFQSQGYCQTHQCHYTMGIGMGGGCPKCNTASYGLKTLIPCPRCHQEFDPTFGHHCQR